MHLAQPIAYAPPKRRGDEFYSAGPQQHKMNIFQALEGSYSEAKALSGFVTAN
jgi:hypothetical protein